MDAVQQQLEDLKHRVNAMEQAEIRLRIQSIGPRGPIGPSGPAGVPGDKGERGARGDNGRDGRDGRDAHTPTREELEAVIVQLLTEYHLLDPDGLYPYAGPNANVVREK
jgi:hypothetical protein